MRHVTSNPFLWPCLLSVSCLLAACGGGGGDDSNGDVGALSPDRSAQSTDAAAEAPDLLIVFPTAAPSGSSVAAFGGGFEGRCGVELFLDTSENSLGTADVEEDGTYSTQVIIPEDVEAGDHLVLVEGRDSSEQGCTEPVTVGAEVPFRVTAMRPVIELADEARPGTTVEVHGRGFCAASECSSVTLLLDGQIGAQDVAVEADGTFVAEAIVPAITAAGGVNVVAVQTSADGSELRAFGELTVTVRPDRSEEVIQ